MAKGFGATAITDQERLGKKSIVSPQLQEVSDQFFSHFRDKRRPASGAHKRPQVDRSHRDRHWSCDEWSIGMARYGRLWP